MLQVEVLDPSDGYAFIKDGEAFKFVRPPYQEVLPASEGQVFRAFDHGFIYSGAQFNSWGDVFDFLRTTRNNFWAKQAEKNPPPPPEELRERLFRIAPLSTLARFCERVEQRIAEGSAGENDISGLELALRVNLTLQKDELTRQRVEALLAEVRKT